MVFLNATVVDGAGGRLERATIRVDGDRISTVGVRPVPTSADPRDAVVVDLKGATVLPGIIDAHVHLSAYDTLPPPMRGEAPHSPELRIFELANDARARLEMGITTVRDVGSVDDHALLLREAVRRGLCPGPRVLTCGRIVSATAPGGVIFGSMYREADGPDDMRRAVREQLRRGADFVKVMATGARSVVLEDPEPAQLTREEMVALVDEAHRMGVLVAAHAEGIGGVRLAVDAGVDTIEHGLSLHREPALLERMAERGTVLVPTLSTFHDVSQTHASKYPSRLVEQAERQREEAYRTLVAARDAGVRLAMGFDSYPAGADAIESVRMVEGGLTPMEGMVAATSGSAHACGLDDVGVIREGAVADLLVVDGDPVADIRILADPGRFLRVIQGGRTVSGAV